MAKGLKFYQTYGPVNFKITGPMPLSLKIVRRTSIKSHSAEWLLETYVSNVYLETNVQCRYKWEILFFQYS